MSPEQFTQIKQHIESSANLSASEKKEWLFLLPRMTEPEMKELDRIISIKMPPKVFSSPPREEGLGEVKVTDIQPPQEKTRDRIGLIHRPVPAPPPPPAPKSVVSDIQPPRALPDVSPLPNPPPQGEGIREKETRPGKGRTTEFLPLEGGGEVGVRKVPNLDIPKPIPPDPASAIRPPISELRVPKSAPVIPELAKLQSLSIEELRKELSIYVFLEKLNQYILALIGKRIPTPDILAAYEKSPLHKSYLQVGMKLMNREKDTLLSREEFEMLADFRTALKKL